MHCPFLRPLVALLAVASTTLVFANPPLTFACGMVFTLHPSTGERIIVPLESTEVVLDVKPGLLEAEVTQTFTNRTATTLEATYAYPLPGDATLTHFELHFRDRVVRSEVREKAQARAVYETAKAEGRKTALLEQNDPSLFSTAVANFLPGETVRVVIRFTQPLTLTTDVVEVRFPMVTGEKYFSPAATPGAPGNAAANPMRRPRDAIAGNHVYAFDIQIAGMPVREIKSPTHRVRVQRADLQATPTAAALERFVVSLEDEITIPDRDFVLRIATRPMPQVQATLITQRTATGDYGLLTLFPPTTQAAAMPAAGPRDVLFVFDRSYSMQGKRFTSAKLGLERCLDLLSPEDRFQIIAFDSEFAFYRSRWVDAIPAQLELARGYVRNLALAGGTEVQPALAAGFDAFERNDRRHIVILLTDGDVGAADSLLNLVETKIGRARLFTFGIGAAPNATLLKKVAEIGRGQARFIHDDGAIEEELIDLFTTLDAPVLTQLRLSLLDAQGNPIEHAMFPERPGDVFARRPLQTVFRTTKGAPAAVVIEGLENERPVRHRLAVHATPQRGDGLEKQFGHRLFADTGMMLRRAQTEPERALIRAEMLATALQFQLVTELTSRVAVDAEIARAPGAALASQHVAQYTPGDQRHSPMLSAPGGEGVVVLTPFEVSTESEHGYTSIGGTRAHNAQRDPVVSIDVLPKELIDDFAAASLEDVLPFTMEAQHDPRNFRAGTDVGLLDGLPLATLVDPATVNRITLQPMGPARSEISQHRAARNSSTTVTARAGESGFASLSLKSSTPVAGRDRTPVLGVFSWARRDAHERLGAFVDTRGNFGRDTLRASVQWRDLDGYGDVRLARASLEHAFSDAVFLKATVAWHELKRDDPRQFRIDSSTARYDGLGFLNLDLLTAETTRLQDAIAQMELSGRTRGAPLTHAWSLRTRWHRRESDWLPPLAREPVAARREHRGLDATYHLALPDDRAALTAHVGWVDHRTPQQTIERQNTRNASLGATWALRRELGVFGSWTREEILPWAQTGTWQVVGRDLRAKASAIEERSGGQLGLRIGPPRGRLAGFVSVFHENVLHHAARDWAWERAHTANVPASLPSGEWRAPVSTRTWPRFTREGWLGALTYAPNRSFSTRATWSQDWAGEGAYRGGNHRASLLARYEVRNGNWKGFAAGVGLSYRDALVFDDGYALQGGMRGDVMLSYRARWQRRGETLLQLNLAKVSDRSWQLTRFAPDRGREAMLSVAQGF